MLNKFIVKFNFLCATLVLVSCSVLQSSYTNSALDSNATIGAVEAERDEIFSLLAYAIVFKSWRENDSIDFSPIGYNIGCIIVNDENLIVSSGLNERIVRQDPTQHAEVIAIQRYLDKPNVESLEGHTIYTSLEPCAQCAGMMILCKLDRVVYGQEDPKFGKAHERLQLDTAKADGYSPYPRAVKVVASRARAKKMLDSGFASYDEHIIEFLFSEQAKKCYEIACQNFSLFTVKYCENVEVYESAKRYLYEN